MNRFLLFLYGAPNLLGVTLALLGVAAYFLGLIGPYWLAIVAGLYGVGFLIAPRRRKEDLQLRRELSAGEVEAGLNALLRKIRRRVPKPIYARVQSIKASIVAVLPHLVSTEAGMDKNIYTIRQTALEYLPETLENYLALPGTYRRVHPLKDGKTAQQLLQEQLDLLDREMQDIVVDLNKQDSDRLLAHGRFLEETFRQGDLFS